MVQGNNLEEQIKRMLANGKAQKPRDMFDRVKSKNKAITTDQIREAVWRLMCSDEVELTAKRQFRLIPHAKTKQSVG